METVCVTHMKGTDSVVLPNPSALVTISKTMWTVKQLLQSSPFLNRRCQPANKDCHAKYNNMNLYLSMSDSNNIPNTMQ